MGCDSQQIVAIFEHMANAIFVNEEYLNELDSVIGDAEHGLNLKRGFTVVLGKLPEFAPLEPARIVEKVGTTLAGAGCGSGPTFYGLAMRAAGRVFAHRGLDTPGQVAAGLEAGLAAIKEKGGAAVGHKTMVDALEPAVAAFRQRAEEGGTMVDAWRAAVAAAEDGMKATIDLVGVKGRGFHAGERGRGHQDPGATSAYLLLKSVYEHKMKEERT